MTALTLQKKIIKQISKIENISILQSIENLIKEEKPIKLSVLQKKLIAISIQEMKNGKGISNEIVLQELEAKFGVT
jgi:hypothetical protein